MNTRAICAVLLGLPTLLSAAQWQVRTSPTNSHLRALALTEHQIVAVGDDSTILTSADGANWRRAAVPVPGVRLSAVAYSSGSVGPGLLVAVGDTLEMFSYDHGTNWTYVTNRVPAQTIYGLTYGQGDYVGVGIVKSNQQPAIFKSFRNGWWVELVRYTPSALRAITRGRNMFVAVGDGGLIMTARDMSVWMGEWIQQPSVTTANLRAVTWSGSQFIAAGEAGVVLTSPDGVTWTVAAPASFSVNGIAASRAEVVAAGNFGSAGRLHESTDGTTWPGNAAQYPSALNAIVRHSSGKYFAVGNDGLILESELTANSWTRPSSGDWQEPFWSLGHLPSIEDGAVMITNAGWKAVAIQSSTTANYPGSLRVRSLNIDAAPDSRNLLLLNYAGLSTPLNPVNDLAIGPNGSLISYYSAIEGGTFNISGGSATFAELAQTRFDGVYVTNGAELVISNGWFEANDSIVSGTNATTVRQFGGTNHFGRIFLSSNARYFLSGGTLSATNLSLWWGVPAIISDSAAFHHSGGEARITTLFLDNGALYEQTGGNLAVSSISLDAARIELKGGSVSSNETFFLHYGGTLFLGADGEYRFGHLMNTSGTLDFGSGKKTLRFTAAGYPPTILDGELKIKNWTGPVSSPNRDRLYFGDNTNGGNYQTMITYFINPEGYPPGSYRAQARLDGEIVPLEPVTLHYTRGTNRITLSWPGSDYELWAGTNVGGPYNIHISDTSPATVPFTGTRRFFILYPKW